MTIIALWLGLSLAHAAEPRTLEPTTEGVTAAGFVDEAGRTYSRREAIGILEASPVAAEPMARRRAEIRRQDVWIALSVPLMIVPGANVAAVMAADRHHDAASAALGEALDATTRSATPPRSPRPVRSRSRLPGWRRGLPKPA